MARQVGQPEMKFHNSDTVFLFGVHFIASWLVRGHRLAPGLLRKRTGYIRLDRGWYKTIDTWEHNLLDHYLFNLEQRMGEIIRVKDKHYPVKTGDADLAERISSKLRPVSRFTVVIAARAQSRKRLSITDSHCNNLIDVVGDHDIVATKRCNVEIKFVPYYIRKLGYAGVRADLINLQLLW